MDIEPQGEAAGELVGLDTQVLSPQAHSRAFEQSTDEDTARDLGAYAAEDGHTLESPALGEPMEDSSLIEKDVVVEEPMVEVPPTREEPAAPGAPCLGVLMAPRLPRRRPSGSPHP